MQASVGPHSAYHFNDVMWGPDSYYEEQAVAYLVGRVQRQEETLSCLAFLQTQTAISVCWVAVLLPFGSDTGWGNLDWKIAEAGDEFLGLEPEWAWVKRSPTSRTNPTVETHRGYQTFAILPSLGEGPSSKPTKETAQVPKPHSQRWPLTL